MSHNGQVELHLHDEITGLTPAGTGSFRQLSRRSEKGTKGTALRSRPIAESHSRRDPGLNARSPVWRSSATTKLCFRVRIDPQFAWPEAQTVEGLDKGFGIRTLCQQYTTFVELID